MASRKERATEKLEAMTRDWKQSEVKAVRYRHRAYAFMPKANDAGVTYRELAELTGLSEIRVAQILRSEREKSSQNGSPHRGRRSG